MTHSDLVAAVKKARLDRPFPEHAPCECYDKCDARSDHCDDLAVLLALHRPFGIYDECDHKHTEGDGSIDCGEFLSCQENKMYDLCFECSRLDPGYPMAPDPDIEVQWPCPTVGIVTDRLASWGVLDGGP